MSKAGVFAHFGSKEDLQMATLEAAEASSLRACSGIRRRGARLAGLLAVCRAWFDYIENDTFGWMLLHGRRR